MNRNGITFLSLGPILVVLGILFLWLLFGYRFLQTSGEWPLMHSFRLEEVSSGCYFSEDFNAPFQDNKWHVWSQDSQISVVVKDGMLAIQGKSSSESEFDIRHVGLISQSLSHLLRGVAEVDMIPDQGDTVFHFCGLSDDYPDYWFQLTSRSFFSGISYVTSKGYSRSYPFNRDIEPSLSATKRTYKIRWQRDPNYVAGYIKKGAIWSLVGDAYDVGVNHVSFELKTITYKSNVYRDVRFDNLRFYSDPERVPIYFVLELEAGLKPLCEVKTQEGVLLAEFDSQHGSEFSFLFPTSILSYPVGLSIELRHPISKKRLHSQPILIPKKGVSGAYPGDVWRISITS